MRTKRSSGTGLVLACVVLAASFVGCPLLKKKSDAGADDETTAVVDAATVAAAGLGAKNEANVLRYANETALNNEAAVIGDHGATARNFPGNGPVVAQLAKGTPVAKIAQYFSTATLVMFDDPSGDGSKLIGWVSPKAFDTAAPPPTKVIVPPNVNRPDAGAVVVRDAGASVQDAGGVATKDAGAGGVDAGGGGGLPPEPPKGAVAVAPTNGKCPNNWQLVEGMCRRKCAADSECPRGTKCVSKQGSKVCTSG